MMAGKRTTREIVDRLRKEAVIDVDPVAVDAYLRQLDDVQPLYVRTMIGFGAWLASLLLIGFVAALGFSSETGIIVMGFAFMAGSVYVRRSMENDFVIQCTLAFSLAGQALFVFGVASFSDFDGVEPILGLMIVLNVILFVVFTDRIHRALSVMLCLGSVGVLFYIWKWNDVIPVLGPGLAAALVFVAHRQAQFIEAGLGSFYRPLLSGLVLSAFGCFLLSTVYVLPELGSSFEFYPRPWISTLLLAALLIHVVVKHWKRMAGTTGGPVVIVGAVFLVAVVAASWLAPGILLALIVVIVGTGTGNRSLMIGGLLFFAVFLGAYFYGIQITMLQKSLTLIASGTVLLLGRWALLAAWPRELADD